VFNGGGSGRKGGPEKFLLAGLGENSGGERGGGGGDFLRARSFSGLSRSCNYTAIRKRGEDFGGEYEGLGAIRGNGRGKTVVAPIFRNVWIKLSSRGKKVQEETSAEKVREGGEQMGGGVAKERSKGKLGVRGEG